MPKKDWEEHREEIERLYIQDRWTLKDIIDHMRLNRGFDAAKPSYERRLRKWGKRKNIVGWGAIAEVSEQRRLHGKESKIIVRNKQVSKDRVNKAVRRHITSAKAINLKYGRAPAPLELPDGIMLRTPSPGLPKRLVYATWIDGSPWLKFWGSATSRGIQAVGLGAKTAMASDSSTLTTATIIMSPTTTSKPMRALDIVFGRGPLINTQEAEGISLTAMRLYNLIPEEYDGQHLKTAMALCDRSRTWPSEEIMIQLFLLGNNFTHGKDLLIDHRSHDKRIVNLLHQLGQNGLQHIKDLLSIQNPTAEAIKEQVFASILRSEDLAMLQFILTTSVDLKVVIKRSTGELHDTPLSLAAGIEDEKESLDFVSLLIDAGADVNYRGYSEKSVLVHALEKGHMAVVHKLIAKGAQACIESLKLAIKTGQDKAVQKILEAGANVNGHFGWLDKMTPIGLVAQQGHISMAQMLIRMGAAINVDQNMRCVVSSGCAYNGHFGNVTPTAPLGVAISEGHLKMAELLLEQLDGETNQLSTSQYAWSLLIDCDRGHDDIVLRLLDAGADVHVADLQGMALTCKRTTLLSAMIRRQHGKINMDLCKVLISKGARLDYALLEATCSNNYEFVTFLLNHNAPLKVSDAGVDRTALGCAIEKGVVRMAQHLYGLGVTDAGNPSCIGNADMVQFLHRTELLSGILRANGSTIFCNAVRKGRKGRKSLIKELMAHDDDIDFSQRTGCVGEFSDPLEPLDTAICFGTPKLIDYLLKRGAAFGRLTLRHAVEHAQRKKILDVLLLSIPDTWGPDDIEPEDGPVGKYHEDLNDPPALISAVQKGYSSVLRTLLNAVNWGSKRIGEALTAAILFDQIGLVEELLLAGASLEEEWSLNDMSPLVVSALAAAVETERVGLAMQLIKAGADVNKPAGDIWSRTALQQAAEVGNLRLVDILLEAGAKVNAPPARCMGATALQCAAIRGHLGIARRLLRAGANVNAEGSDDEGRTALEGAAEHGRLEMVHLLLKSGARLKGIYTSQYLDAVKLAKENGHNAVARLLESVHSTRTEQIDLDDDDDYLPSSDESGSEQTDGEQDVRDTPSLSTGAFTDEFMTSSECQALHECMVTDQADSVSCECLPSGENDITGEVMNGVDSGELWTAENNFIDENVGCFEPFFNEDEAQSFARNPEFSGVDGLPTTGSQSEWWDILNI